VVVIALPDALAARSIVDHVRAVNEHATIVARTHSEHERTELLRRGASEVLVAELEIGNAMATHVLQRLVPARATS
jgi:voltage-gated potassium channel Kch